MKEQSSLQKTMREEHRQMDKSTRKLTTMYKVLHKKKNDINRFYVSWKEELGIA